jgi:hypothetical protein
MNDRDSVIAEAGAGIVLFQSPENHLQSGVYNEMLAGATL